MEKNKIYIFIKYIIIYNTYNKNKSYNSGKVKNY